MRLLVVLSLVLENRFLVAASNNGVSAQSRNLLQASDVSGDAPNLEFTPQVMLGIGKPRAQSDSTIPGGSPIETCDTTVPQLVHIDKLEVDPNPPQIGKNVTLNASGTINTNVSKGSYVDVQVRYGLIQIIKKRYDLCEILGQADFACPLKEGPRELKQVIFLPDIIPPGVYTFIAQAYTAHDELLTCLTGTFDFTGLTRS